MKSIFSGNKIVVFLHLLAWAIILGLPIYFFKRWEIGKDFIWLYYIGNILNGIIFYTNYLVLVPKFFFATKKHRYYISVLVMLIFIYFISSGSNRLIFKYVPGRDHTEEARKPPEEARKSPEEGRKPGPPVPGRFLADHRSRQCIFSTMALLPCSLYFFPSD